MTTSVLIQITCDADDVGLPESILGFQFDIEDFSGLKRLTATADIFDDKMEPYNLLRSADWSCDKCGSIVVSCLSGGGVVIGRLSLGGSPNYG